jgi:hypothetical protein
MGRVVNSCSARLLGGEFVGIPNALDANELAGMSFLPRGLADVFEEAVAALVETSAIVAIAEGGQLLRTESDALERAVLRAELATDRFVDDRDADSADQNEAFEILLEIRDIVHGELGSDSHEEQSDPPFAHRLHEWLQDPEPAVELRAIIGSKILLIEDALARL